LFEQVIVIGEAKPFLTAIITIEEESWKNLAKELGVSENISSLESEEVKSAILERINNQLIDFPGYAKIIRAHIVLQPWDIEGGLITPTLKLKRSKIIETYQEEIIELYRGH